MKTASHTSATIFNWEADRPLAENRTPNTRKNRANGKLIAAGIITAFIIVIAIAGSCGSDSPAAQPGATTDEPRRYSAAPADSTTTSSTTQAPQPECPGNREPVYTKLTNSWRCQFPTLRCGTGEKRIVENDTQRCRTLTSAERLAVKCSGSPYMNLDGKLSNAIAGKCIVLVCDTPKDRGSYYATTYSCGGEWWDDGTGYWHDSHPSVRPYREALGWEDVSIVKRELAKLGWADCQTHYFAASHVITEYDGIVFACS